MAKRKEIILQVMVVAFFDIKSFIFFTNKVVFVYFFELDSFDLLTFVRVLTCFTSLNKGLIDPSFASCHEKAAMTISLERIRSC